MAFIATMTVNAASGGMRTLLLVLVIVAMVLIITGAIVAAMTWMNMRKAGATQSGAILLESEHA